MKQLTTKIIAHRGFSSQFPENTLLAFRKAIEIGADLIELDVHKTKDNYLVVIHDDSVDRTSSDGSTGFIAAMTLVEVQNVSAGYAAKLGQLFKNEKIPLLKEVLKLAKGKIKVCIEIKVAEIEAEILQIINELAMNDEVILFCFSPSVLANLRKLDAKIPLLFLVEKIDNSNIEHAASADFNAIGGGSQSIITKELVNFAHSKNIEIWRWTVDDENEMKDLLEIQIDGLITNKPDAAKEIKYYFENK